METCAICGKQFPANTMDMTGHGLRCVECAAKSELAKFHGGSEMAEHLNPQELEEVVRSGGNEAAIGGVLGISGIILTVLSLAAGGAVVVVCSGMMIGGFSALGHGLFRRRQARAALRHYPSARALKA